MKTIKRLSNKKLRQLEDRIMHKRRIPMDRWSKMTLRLMKENLRRLGLL